MREPAPRAGMRRSSSGGTSSSASNASGRCCRCCCRLLVTVGVWAMAFVLRGAHGFAFFGTTGVGAGARERLYQLGAARRTLPRLVQQRQQQPVNRRRQTTVCRLQAPRAFRSDDWWPNIINLPKSKLLQSISSHLLFNTAWAGAVSVVHGMLPDFITEAHISTVPHSIMASALGLLLVFRSNAAYDRFWEARKVWGCITNTTRNLSRLAQTCMCEEKATYLPLLEYLKAYPWLLKQHLQDVRDDAELSWLALPPEEVDLLLSSQNPPLMACERMTQVIQLAYGYCGGKGCNGDGAVCREDDTSVAYRIAMETEINKLVDFLGMCERILTTPVPRSYSRHTSRFLTVYLFTLPIVLVPYTEYWTALIVGLCCWGLLSIEGIAYYIEQPFDAERQQLPMTQYCKKVYLDITRISQPPPLPPFLTEAAAAARAGSGTAEQQQSEPVNSRAATGGANSSSGGGGLQ